MRALGLLCRRLVWCAAAVAIASRLPSGLDWLVARKWAFRERPTVEWVF